jgi:lipoprotein NlpI
VLAIVKPEERTTTYKSNVIEAYEYLGYYYVTKKDDAKAKEQWLIVKELDPSNEKANNYLNPKKPQAPTGGAPKK